MSRAYDADRAALDAAARAAWEADRHLTRWDDLPESVRDVMRNLVRVPVQAALAADRLLCENCRPLPPGNTHCPRCGYVN